MTFVHLYKLHEHINDEHMSPNDATSDLPPLPEAQAIVVDPLDISPDLIPSPVILDADEEFADAYREKWSDIRTKIRKGPIQDLYRIRLSSSDPNELFKNLSWIFSQVLSPHY